MRKRINVWCGKKLTAYKINKRLKTNSNIKNDMILNDGQNRFSSITLYHNNVKINKHNIIKLISFDVHFGYLKSHKVVAISKHLLHAKNFYNRPKRQSLISRFFLIISGALVGAINGFWGGGGGMVCVPILSNITKLSEKNAHATTMLVILPLSLISAFVYYNNDHLNTHNLWWIIVLFSFGGVVGALILKKINNLFLQFIFALIIIFAGVKMIL